MSVWCELSFSTKYDLQDLQITIARVCEDLECECEMVRALIFNMASRSDYEAMTIERRSGLIMGCSASSCDLRRLDEEDAAQLSHLNSLLAETRRGGRSGAFTSESGYNAPASKC